MNDPRLSRLERRLVWIFGSPRSGSTWIAGLLTTLSGGHGINEPLIGLHLGALSSDTINAPARTFRTDQLRVVDNQHESHSYFFNDEFRSTWLPSLRELILRRFRAELQAANDDGRRPVIVKEPNGSTAADLLVAATPRARMLFLLRDGRDVVDSQLDAAQPDSWLSSARGGGEDMSPQRRLDFLDERARRWVANTAIVTAAFDSLPEARRLQVRYEDLLAEPRPQLVRILQWLDVDAPADLDAMIAARAFSTIPESGAGQFARSATPGMWRQNLTPEEQSLLTEVLGATLARLGYDA
jgi:hypothetical protein